MAYIEFDGDEPFIGKCFLLVTTAALLLAYFFPLLVHLHSLSPAVPAIFLLKKNLECVCVCVCVCVHARAGVVFLLFCRLDSDHGRRQF